MAPTDGLTTFRSVPDRSHIAAAADPAHFAQLAARGKRDRKAQQQASRRGHRLTCKLLNAFPGDTIQKENFMSAASPFHIPAQWLIAFGWGSAASSVVSDRGETLP